jgi:hypothetical protein
MEFWLFECPKAVKTRAQSLVLAARLGKQTYPSISTMRVIWLYSLVPGNKGRPKNNSTAMHPKDHISIADVYGTPKSTSGDL